MRTAELNEKITDWIDWTRIKADCLDPLLAVSDIIVDRSESRYQAIITELAVFEEKEQLEAITLKLMHLRLASIEIK